MPTSKPTLKRGSYGVAVKTLQKYLNEHFDAGLKVDGVFGPHTQAKVVEYQKAQQAKNPKHAVDGVVGPQTWIALEANGKPSDPKEEDQTLDVAPKGTKKDRTELVKLPITVRDGDAFVFDLPVQGGKEISPIQLDTGAFALMIDTETATALGLQQEGEIAVSGVGGSVPAWTTTLPVQLGEEVFDMYCVVDPEWDTEAMGTHGLFGMKNIVSNGLAIDVDPKKGTLTIYKG